MPDAPRMPPPQPPPINGVFWGRLGTRPAAVAEAFQRVADGLLQTLQQLGLLHPAILGHTEFTVAAEEFRERFASALPRPFSATDRQVRHALPLLHDIETLAHYVLSFAPPGLGELVVGATQVTHATGDSARELHHDNTAHGDLVVTLTVLGSGFVDMARQMWGSFKNFRP